MWCNDGQPDNYDSTISYALNLGMNGNTILFSSPSIVNVGANPSDITVGDLNGDSSPDVAVSITNGAKVFFYSLFLFLFF